MFDDRPSAWVPKRLGFDGVVANIMGGLYEPACSAVIPFLALLTHPWVVDGARNGCTPFQA